MSCFPVPCHADPMTFTIVSVHAHPDDEALLTGGTLARAAAAGHRVVLVTATDGAAGLTSPDMAERGELGRQRLVELEKAAAALGCQRVVALGYGDGALSCVDPVIAAQRLAGILEEESADVVTIYDSAGGYGHPDHVQVHRLGGAAARLAGTPVVLEATVDRQLIIAAIRAVRLIPGAVKVRPADFATAYTARRDITHRVDVRDFVPQKRQALAAHHSQTVGGSGGRTLSLLLGLPGFLASRALGYEWFVEHGRVAAKPALDDIFASLR